MICFIPLLLSFISILHADEPGEWKKSLDKDGIIIYTRQLPDARFLEFLAETTIAGTVEEFKEVISNVENYPNWVSDCKETQVIENSNSNEILYYMKISVPFPFEGRDVVQKIQLAESKNKIVVQITNHPDRVPQDKKLVRMKEAYGSWIVTDAADNKVKIKFQYYADPSGDIPAWMVNAFIVKSPNKTLRNLRDLMSQL
jgi:ribosome-associated toxin RatA of RatAB toxin-antitoxin module